MAQSFEIFEVFCRNSAHQACCLIGKARHGLKLTGRGKLMISGINPSMTQAFEAASQKRENPQEYAQRWKELAFNAVNNRWMRNEDRQQAQALWREIKRLMGSVVTLKKSDCFLASDKAKELCNFVYQSVEARKQEDLSIAERLGPWFTFNGESLTAEQILQLPGF